MMRYFFKNIFVSVLRVVMSHKKVTKRSKSTEEPPAAKDSTRVSSHSLYQDQLCLWYQSPAQLKSLLLLHLSSPEASPVPMDCLRAATDLWTPDLKECLVSCHGKFNYTLLLKAVQLCPSLNSLDLSGCGFNDRYLIALIEACHQITDLKVPINTTDSVKRKGEIKMTGTGSYTY